MSDILLLLIIYLVYFLVVYFFGCSFCCCCSCSAAVHGGLTSRKSLSCLARSGSFFNILSAPTLSPFSLSFLLLCVDQLPWHVTWMPSGFLWAWDVLAISAFCTCNIRSVLWGAERGQLAGGIPGRNHWRCRVGGWKSLTGAISITQKIAVIHESVFRVQLTAHKSFLYGLSLSVPNRADSIPVPPSVCRPLNSS